MDLHLISALIGAMQESDLAEMEVRAGAWTLRLAREGALSPDASPGAGAVPESAVSESAVPAGVGPQPGFPASSPPSLRPAPAGVTAPLAGIVHLTPGPDQPPFVQPGQKVSPGDTLCLIEAMKVFNAIKSDREGVVARVLVASDSEVEAGQMLVSFA